MCEPFVMDSSRRRKETSCAARPGAVCDDALICDTRMGLPVKVAKTSCWMRYLEPLNLRRGGVCVVVILADFYSERVYFCLSNLRSIFTLQFD